MALSTFLGAVFAIVCFLNSGNASSTRRLTATPQREAVTPRWRVNLRSTTGSVPLGLVVGHGHETRLQPYTSLWYIDNATIVVTFVIREGQENPKLSRRDASDTDSPFRLRAVLLDATTGGIKATPTWPTESRLASIVVAHDGKFVTERGRELTLYSRDTRELKSMKLPPTKETGWVARPSPSGKNILFVAENLRTRSAVPWIWLETDRLQVLRSWEETQSGWVGISDNWIAMTACGWVYDCEPYIEVRGLATDWKKISPASRHQKPHPQFVDDNLLFLLGHPTRLVRPDGDAVFVEDMPFEGCWWGGAIPSASGRRVVVPSCKLTSRVEALDIGGSDVLEKILLYDAPFKGLSHEIAVQGPKIKERTQIAVSPDGSHLAILNDEFLEIIQLPPLQ